MGPIFLGYVMRKLTATLAIYAQDLRDDCGIVPDMDLLHRVTLLLGPQALNPNTAQILETGLPKVVKDFMASHDLPLNLQGDMVRAVIDTYPKPNRYRAVIAYLIAQNFGLGARILGRQSFNL